MYRWYRSIPFKNIVPIYPYLISEGWRNCANLWPVQQQPVALCKHVTKYKHMRKWMVEFFRKSESCGFKIARVNSICIAKSINIL